MKMICAIDTQMVISIVLTTFFNMTLFRFKAMRIYCVINMQMVISIVLTTFFNMTSFKFKAMRIHDNWSAKMKTGCHIPNRYKLEIAILMFLNQQQCNDS